MRKTTSINIVIITSCLFFQSPAIADEADGTIIRTSGGCLGGAMVGTAILAPGIGTFLGCVAAGIFGYFGFGLMDGEESTDRALASSQ